MFQLTKDEFDILKSDLIFQNGTSKSLFSHQTSAILHLLSLICYLLSIEACVCFITKTIKTLANAVCSLRAFVSGYQPKPCFKQAWPSLCLLPIDCLRLHSTGKKKPRYAKNLSAIRTLSYTFINQILPIMSGKLFFCFCHERDWIPERVTGLVGNLSESSLSRKLDTDAVSTLSRVQSL